MQNVIAGTLMIALCMLLYFRSYKHWKKNNYASALSFIVLAGFILRIFCSFDFYLHEWDERFHALVAKNLIDFPFKPMLYVDPLLEYDYRNWAGNHVWVHKQPFPLYSMAMSMFLFGKNVIAMRLPTIIISTSAILSTYKIGDLLCNKKIALVAAFLFSINGLLIEQTAGRVATDHFDVFFLSLISWAVYFILKYVDSKSRWAMIASAVFTGLAILTKWLPALIVLPIWFVAEYNQRKFISIVGDVLLFLIVVFSIAMPWQWYIYSTFPLESSWEYLYNRKHIYEALELHDHPWVFHLNRMRIIFGELIYIPILWLIYKSIQIKIFRKHLILLVWIVIPYLFFTIVKTKMQGYVLITAPAIFIVIALFINNFYEYTGKRKLLVKTICVFLLLLPIRYSFERVKPFNGKDRTQPWISEMKKLDNSIDEKRKVIFNCKYPIQTMFFTSFTAYERIPSVDKLIELNNDNVRIYLDDRIEIRDQYKALDFIEFVSISSIK